MIVKEGKARLKKTLGNKRLTVLLLLGARDSKAGEVHEFFMKDTWEDWRRCFLIMDPALLTPAEKSRWFGVGNSDRYAVVGGRKTPKDLGKRGPIKDLLNSRGKPDVFNIAKAFGSGDKLP